MASLAPPANRDQFIERRVILRWPAPATYRQLMQLNMGLFLSLQALNIEPDRAAEMIVASFRRVRI